ncbi:MAG TPA: hypothetical protein PK586_11500 [Casimicrobium sp.]|nr:hypothetical protein [Casimicrobium sp.]
MKNEIGIKRVAVHMRATTACALICLLAITGTAHAQLLKWGSFNALAPFGSGNTATSQTLNATVPGVERGTGTIAVSLNVGGGVASWNGFGVGTNDDGYFSAPNQPQPGITMITGAPGYNGGIPALSAASFATGYNAAGGPVGLPAPPSDRAAVYFDSGTGTTITSALSFTSLVGGALPAGSWIFIDNVDQGERVTVTGPNGWAAAVHFGDSTLPRPPVSLSFTPVSAPSFPLCAPAATSTASTLQFDGRYGDVSTTTPTCSNVPVPVQGQTVGYTKGMDSVGVWIRTAIDLTTLSVTAVDMDPTPPNAPDNNFSLGLAVISATELPAAAGVPTLDALALTVAVLMLLMAGLVVLLRSASPKNTPRL